LIQQGITPPPQITIARILRRNGLIKHKKRAPYISKGKIHVVRFIRSDLKFHLFGMYFPVPEKVKHEYVLGVIITHEHRLVIFKEQEYILEFPFVLY